MKRHLLALLHRTRGGHMFHGGSETNQWVTRIPTMSDQEMEQWYRSVQNAVEEAKMSGRNNLVDIPVSPSCCRKIFWKPTLGLYSKRVTRDSDMSVRASII